MSEVADTSNGTRDNTNCARPFESLQELVLFHARERPKAKALIDPRRVTLTYGALSAWIGDVVSALRKVGVHRQDRVAVVMPEGLEATASIIAVATGAVCVPIYPGFTPDEWLHYFRELQVAALVTSPGLDSESRGVARALGTAILDVHPIRSRSPEISIISPGERLTTSAAGIALGSDDAIVLLTSGTTSRPKMVPLTQRNICQSICNVGAALELQERDRLLSVLPLFHGHGLISGVLSALAAGSSVVCTRGFEATEFFNWLAELRPTWYTAVPTIHRAVLSEARRRKMGRGRCSLRLIRSASSPLPLNVLEGLEAEFSVPVLETYGMTEASTQIAANPLNLRKPGSVGPPSGPEIAIFDDNDRFLPTSTRGEIALRGPTITRGYLNDSAANAVAFRNGWFRTGDLGYLDEAGYLFVLGRTKPAEIINRGGQKVAPRQVEEVLHSHPEVAEAVAFPIPHDRLGEDVGAAVTLKGSAKVTPVELRQFASERLARFKIPSVIRVINQIPRDANGIISRTEIANAIAMSEPQQICEIKRAQAATELERNLSQLWAELLELDHVSVDEDVFTLGADSLTITQMLARIWLWQGAKLSIKDIFDAPTIAAQADRLRRCLSTAASPPSQKEMSIDSRKANLSFQQQRIYFLSKIARVGHTYNIVEALRWRGCIDVRALGEAIAAVALRHEVLRSTFHERLGEPIQSVSRLVPLLEQINIRRCSKRRRTDLVRRRAQELLRQPIDLKTGPIFRAQLLRFADDDHALAIKSHHLVTDGLSQRVLWKELRAEYLWQLEGDGVRPAKLPMNYRKFVAWQRSWLRTSEAEKQRRYWQAQLQGLSPLPLRSDKPRPLHACGQAARQKIALSPNLVRRLTTLCTTNRVTRFMVLVAAFQWLLFRYTRHADIGVGTLMSNRMRADAEPLMGMLANTVVLRTDLGGDPDFIEVLRRVRQVTLEALQNQDLPIEEALKPLQFARNGNQNALLPVMFKLQNTSLRAPAFPRARVRFVELDPGVAQHDLVLELIDDDDRIHGWLEYDTDLFEAATMEQMARHFMMLLQSITDDPRRKISRISLMSAQERRRIVGDWNDTQTPVRTHRSVWQCLTALAKRSPEALAVSTSAQRLTYRELARRGAAVANALRRAGVGRESIVVLCAERGLNFLTAVIGIQGARGAFLPMDPSVPAARLAQIIEHSGTSLVLTDDHCVGPLREATSRLPPKSRPQLISLQTLPDDCSKRPTRHPPPAPSSLAYVIYTSGSTGVPKGAMVEQRGLVNHLRSQINDLQLSAHDVVAQTAPQSFVLSVWQSLAPLMVGARVHICDDHTVRDPLQLAREIELEGITVLQVVPTLLRSIVSQPAHNPSFSALGRLRWLLCCGEMLPPDLLAAWFQYFPKVPVLHAYGQTECSDDVTTHPLRFSPTGSAVPIGKPIANMRVYVLDADLQPVPTGVAGELCVGGIGVGRGYLNDPDQTNRSFIRDPFSGNHRARLYKTGDLGRWRSDGTLEFIGRLDYQLKVRGYRVEPGEIEHVLRQHPAIDAAAVLMRKSEGDEPRLVAYLQAAVGNDCDTREVHAFLKARLPDYMVPSGYLILARLPLTSHGKVDRLALLASSEQISFGSFVFAAPRNSIEKTLAGIWSKLLGLERVGISENFFELGGHSLLAGQVVARIDASLGISLSMKDLFEAPTIEALARRIGATPNKPSNKDAVGISRKRSPGPQPVSLFQEHVLSIERDLPGLPQFTLPFAFHLQGKLDVSALGMSIAAVVNRHEALRTRFAWRSGKPIATIDPAAWRTVLVVEELRSGVPGVRHLEKHLRHKAVLLAEQEAWSIFDLAREPPLRARLLRKGANESVLLLTLHHIIIDGWSIGVLLREISDIYRGYLTGRQVTLALPELQFSDFSHWQRSWCATKQAEQQVGYWKKHLRKSVRLFSGDARLSSRVGHVTFDLEPELVSRLSAISRSRDATLFMSLLAGFKVLLLACCRRSDICVATPMANRSDIGSEQIIGPMANTVVLRTRLDADPSFEEALKRVRRTVLEAHERQQLPFDFLAARLAAEDECDPVLLLQVFFELQSSSRGSLMLPDVSIRPFGNAYGEGFPRMPINQTWLTATLREGPSGITGSLIYKRNLLTPAKAKDWATHYVAMLSRISMNPRTRLSELVRMGNEIDNS